MGTHFVEAAALEKKTSICCDAHFPYFENGKRIAETTTTNRKMCGYIELLFKKKNAEKTAKDIKFMKKSVYAS